MLGRSVSTFFKELKRRKVYRTGAAYAVVAFVVWQVADLLFPALDFPEWTVDFVVVLSVLGFPLALVLAWAFEVTPDGVRRTERPSGSTGPARPPGGKSVAVLPFTNMSADPEQEYFGEGLAEEILNALTQVDDLKVAARTSSFAYKGERVDIRDVGRHLSVDHVLEGSVRKSGDRIRVTAQLVTADDGYHLWSETFDRRYDDVFAIQDEVTAAVVEALRVELLEDEEDRLSRVGTESAEAYDLYLRGRHYWHRRYRVGLQTSLEYFERALEIDPEFALAHAGISNAYVILGLYGMLPPEETEARAIEAADRAVEYGPNLPESHFARAMVLGDIHYDLAAAGKAHARALALDPTFGRAALWRAIYHEAGTADLGIDPEEGADRVYAENPDSDYLCSIAGIVHQFGGRLARADQYLDRVLDRNPEYVAALIGRGFTASDRGDHDRAIAALEKAAELTNRASFALAFQGSILARAGRTDEALEVWRALEDRSKSGDRYVASLFRAAPAANLGRTEEALDLLEDALERSPQGFGLFVGSGMLDPLRGEPRFEAILEELTLA